MGPLSQQKHVLNFEPKEVKHRRALRRESTEETETCAETRAVQSPVPAKSKASAGIIDVEEQALLAKYYADLAQLRQQKKECVYRGKLGPNTLCWFHCAQRLC